MKTIELQVFWKDPNEPNYEELGLPLPPLRLKRPVRFVRVDGINTYEKDGNIWGVVMCGGEEYITDRTWEQLCKIIEEL